MKYRIFDIAVGRYLGDDAILTQDGLVAFWDESEGWQPDNAAKQDEYRIEFLVPHPCQCKSA